MFIEDCNLLIMGCSELRHTRHILILEYTVFTAGDIPKAVHMSFRLAQVPAWNMWQSIDGLMCIKLKWLFHIMELWRDTLTPIRWLCSLWRQIFNVNLTHANYYTWAQIAEFLVNDKNKMCILHEDGKRWKVISRCVIGASCILSKLRTASAQKLNL